VYWSRAWGQKSSRMFVASLVGTHRTCRLRLPWSCGCVCTNWCTSLRHSGGSFPEHRRHYKHPTWHDKWTDGTSCTLSVHRRWRDCNNTDCRTKWLLHTLYGGASQTSSSQYRITDIPSTNTLTHTTTKWNECITHALLCTENYAHFIIGTECSKHRHII
jgi:hypothetical protein